MKLSTPSILAAAVAMASNYAVSAETYVNVFYQSNPMQGIEISIDGETPETTNQAGRATLSIEDGKHTLKLLRGDDVLASLNFNTEDGDDAEISISFEGESQEPEITINTYEQDDQSAKGYIGGIIRSNSGTPLASASISTTTNAGDEVSATTNADGLYEIELPRGTYALKVSHPDYTATSMNDLRVMADLGTAASVNLASNSAPKVEIGAPVFEQPAEEMLISGSYKRVDSSLDVERFSANVVDAMDMTQIARVGDADVAGAIQRLVGVSVTGSKYANLRGLDGRYISSTLNGFLMPSTDPMRRDVQLDIFPSNILEGIEVQKSYSADLLGTTTGGQLKINTRGLPDGLSNKASVSLGVNTSVTGEDIVSYQSSSTDFWGYDSGLRDLPKNVVDATGGARSLSICDPAFDPVRCTSPLDAAFYSVEFQNDYNIKPKSANPDFSVSLSHENLLPLSEAEFGYIGAASFKHSTKNRADAEYTNPLDKEGNYERSTEETSANAYLVAGFKYRDEDEILSRTILLRDTSNTTTVGDYIRDDRNDKKVTLEWIERQFISQQITGKNLFDFSENSHQLDWRLGFSETSRYEPDRRSYLYINNNLSTSGLERRWSDLTEQSIDLGLDYTINYDWNSSIYSEIKLGLLSSDREREVEMYRFGVRLGDNSDELDFSGDQDLEEVLFYQNYFDDRVRLATKTTNTDSYNAEESLSAQYITTTTNFGDQWTLLAGVRLESFEQTLFYPNQTEDFQIGETLNSDEPLPALLLTYIPNNSWQFRAGWSSTVSYPGLIERSESLVYDPETDEEVYGNPSLEVTNIDNIDLRAEYYFSDEDSISVAYFTKELDKPVEKAVADGSGSSSDGYTFRHQEQASISGIEIDGSKIFETESWLYTISGNISFIDSSVEFSPDSIRLEGADSDGRELQGQSPLLANLQFGFDHLGTEQKITLLINMFDDRIFRISRGNATGPIYEVGRTNINLNYEKLIGDSLTIKGKIENLLDDEVQYSQNDRVIESYKEGAKYSISASYQF